MRCILNIDDRHASGEGTRAERIAALQRSVKGLHIFADVKAPSGLGITDWGLPGPGLACGVLQRDRRDGPR